MTTATILLKAVRDYLRGRDAELPRNFAGITDCIGPMRPVPPRPLSCLRHLDRAARLAGAAEGHMAAILASGCTDLAWGQTYGAADFGDRFLDNYGWVELAGTRGHFASDEIAAGFLLLGPQTHYPNHHHVAEEVYITLTSGAAWSMDGGPAVLRSAGEIIHHPSGVSHAMRTGEAPLLALYLWRGGDLAQRSVIDWAR